MLVRQKITGRMLSVWWGCNKNWEREETFSAIQIKQDIFNVRKEVGARLWSQLSQRKKWMQKFGKSGDLNYAFYTTIFHMSFPYLIYEFKEKLHYIKLCATRCQKCSQTPKKCKSMATAVTTMLCNHNRDKEFFDHTVIAMKLELHTSHQKASSSPCSGGILGPRSRKYCSRCRRRKSWLLSSGNAKA